MALVVGVAGDRRRRLEQLLVFFLAVRRETCSAAEAEPAHACNLGEEISGGQETAENKVCVSGVWVVDGYILPRLLLLLPLLSSTTFARAAGRSKGYIYTHRHTALAVEPNLQWEDNARRLLPTPGNSNTAWCGLTSIICVGYITILLSANMA